MNTIQLNVSVLFLIILTSYKVTGQQICVEVKDRQHLPKEIYPELKDYKAILIGEMHGNNETPQYAEGMVNLLLDEGQKVLFGIEMEGYEQSRIDSFISSGDFAIIKRMAFFNNRFKSGQSSVAMSNLIKSCYGKPNLKVICIDITDYKKRENKDSMMAIGINNALKLNPGYTMITLTGNIHNKMDSNQWGKPMGYWLYKMADAVLNRKEIASIDVVYDTGACWCCQPDCRIHQESGWTPWIRDKCNYDNLFRKYNNGDMFLYTKTITASLPLNP